MIFASTNQNKKVLQKYTKFWNETKNQIETINGGKTIKSKKDFMKISFELDGYLPLGKILNIPSLIIFTISAFQEDSKYYPQIYLHECVYEL